MSHGRNHGKGKANARKRKRQQRQAQERNLRSRPGGLLPARLQETASTR